MRVIVFPHALEPGGSQMNAIDIARELTRRGDEVLVFGPRGPLVERIEAAGLEYREAPVPRWRPSRAVQRSLLAAVDAFGADVVHAFEWPPAIESILGPLRRRGTPVVCTVMSMSVAPFIPAWVPLTVGTRRIFDVEAVHRDDVTLIEPPVDIEHDAPGDQGAARRALELPDEVFVVGVVSRLAPELKLEGILALIAAVGALAAELPLRLVIAGAGPAEAEVAAVADAVNAGTGTRTVMLTGNLDDPRPVYDASDLVAGMGGSALRAMAHAKPVVVQGERGFWRLLTPYSAPEFAFNGWYGIGDGTDGASAVAAIIRDLAGAADDRAQLGEFSRQLVEVEYGLPRITARIEEVYARAIAERQRAGRPGGLTGTLVRVRLYDLGRKIRRRLGGVARDDFNSLAAMERGADPGAAP